MSNSATDTARSGFTQSESNRLRLDQRFAAKRKGLIATVLLSEAFFYKCGHRALPSTPVARHTQGERPEKEPDPRSRVECVKRNIKRLHDEAQITVSELRTFLQLEVVATPEVVLNREPYYRAAYILPVNVMAIVLQMLFGACPDEPAEAVVEKVFVWLCGKGWEQAVIEKDKRLIRREGVGMSEFGGLGRISGIDTEFRQIFETLGGEDE